MPLLQKNYKTYLHMLTVISLMLFIRYIPPIGCITPLGMEILGIFLGMLYGWTFCSMIWPSLLGLIFIGLSDYTTVAEIISNGAGHSTVLFLFFLYIFCGVIDASGVTEIIGQYFVSLKIAQGHPYILAFLLCFTAWLLGGLISAVAAIILLWQVFADICQQLGYKKGAKYPTLVIIGIIYSGMIGSTIFPFKVYPIIMMGVYQSTTGNTIPFLPFTIFMATLTLLLVIVYILLCKFVLRPPVIHTVAVIPPPKTLTSFQKKIVAILGFMIIAFFVPSVLPAHWKIVVLLNELGTTGIVIFILVLCMLIHDNGKPMLNMKEAIQKGMSWDIYFLVLAAFPLSNALISDSTGIKEFVINNLSVLLGQYNSIIFCFILIALSGILANIISNVVMPMLIVPLVVTFSANIGINIVILVCLLCIVMMDTIMLPSGSPVAGLLLANEWVAKKDVYKYGCIILMMTILLCVIVGIPFGNFIF